MLEKENRGEVVPSSLRVPRILSYLSPYSLKLQNTHALTIMNLTWQAIDTKDDTNPKQVQNMASKSQPTLKTDKHSMFSYIFLKSSC